MQINITLPEVDELDLETFDGARVPLVDNLDGQVVVGSLSIPVESVIGDVTIRVVDGQLEGDVKLFTELKETPTIFSIGAVQITSSIPKRVKVHYPVALFGGK